MSDGHLGQDGLFTFAGQRYRASHGRGGITGAKVEGDGATPAGPLVLRRILYRADRVARPRTSLLTAPLAPHDGWCDDPDDAQYNCMVRLPHGGRSEELWRSDAVYDVIAVLGWNDDPVVPRRGSAIFLHVAREDYAPTDGCLALALNDLRTVLETGLTRIVVS